VLTLNDVRFGIPAMFPFPGAHAIACNPRPCQCNLNCGRVQVAYECLHKAIKVVKPGTRYRKLGEIISEHAEKHGFGVVRTYCGHGIGEHFHCAPNVPHFAGNKAKGVIQVRCSVLLCTPLSLLCRRGGGVLYAPDRTFSLPVFNWLIPNTCK
jgi:hypothetical protein